MDQKATDAPKLTRKDFTSDQEVRWCPGCGDYSILAQVQRTLPDLGLPREKYVVVAGIGCSSRFPYYMNTYGIHTIHGRAPAFATGVKSANPDLSVWLITGDGDGLSIGGNHLLHILRRNVEVRILLFNNRIYGLTKGQYSPTSPIGKRTGSTPFGSIDHPVDPIRFALGADASFVARVVDVDAKQFQSILTRAAMHRGTAFVEIYQNCPIFNDDAFIQLADKKQRPDHALYLEHGEKMLFGPDKDKGIAYDAVMLPRVVAADDPAVLVHDETNLMMAQMLALMEGIPGLPTPLGVFRAVDRPTYERQLNEQVEAQKALKTLTIQEVLESGETWTVSGP
jgi:2-oxoglutarate ferredoxin oxidoreductase subunit beta